MNTTYDPLPVSETITPTDQAAVAERVRGASEDGTAVYPIGGGTSLDYGAHPLRAGLGLSLAKLDRVVDYPARDLTITAEAGVTLEALSKQLATEGQRLPVDVPQAGQATLGGVVACSLSGPRRFRWGTMRDYVIGLSAVDGSGTVFSGGGRVVKNAAGYNLCRLLTGSLGTLGVITQVTLMVRPTADVSALMACPLVDAASAERLLSELVHTRTLPSAVDLVAGPAWDDATELGEAAPLGRLVVGLEGSEAEVRWMEEQLADEWRRLGMNTPVSVSQIKVDRVWQRLVEFPAEIPNENGLTSLVVQISVFPSKTVDLVVQLRRADPTCSIQAHAASGVLRVRMAVTPGQTAAKLDRELRPMVRMAGGHLVVLRATDNAPLARADVWGPIGDGAAVMQAIKDRFDPKGILNPDRFVYGRQ